MQETGLQEPRRSRTKKVQKEGEEVLQVLKQRFLPLHPVENCMVKRAVPLQTPSGVCARAGMQSAAHRAHTRAGLLPGPVGDPCCSSLLMKDCTLWKGPMLDGEGHQESEDEIPEMKQYGLTTTPIPHPPVPLWGRRQKSRGKLSPRRREGWEEGGFSFVSASCYPTLLLSENKLN